MKATITEKQHGAVAGSTTVRIAAPPEDLVELRKALATVYKFEKLALQVAGESKNADWTMVEYGVKTDAVFVTVRTGMCG